VRIQRYFWLCLSVFLWQGCQIGNTTWESDWLAPLAVSTLDLQKLTGDTLISADAQDRLWFTYSQNILNLDVDTLTDLEDILSQETAFWPFGNFTVDPGNTIPLNPIVIRFGAEPVELTQAILREGKLRVVLSSVLTESTRVRYRIPLATKNSMPILLTETIPAFVPGGDTVRIIREIDLSGYRLDLRTQSLNRSNRLEILLELELPATSGPLSLQQNQFLLSVNTELVDLSPRYARGYLGQQFIEVGGAPIRIDFLEKVSAEVFNLSEVEMDLELVQTLGAEVRIRPKYLTGKNMFSGQSISLQHEVFGSTVNLDRAQENAALTAPIPILRTWNFTPTNSTIVPFLENLPGQLDLGIGLEINPFGNISGHKDFIFPGSLPELNLRLRLPLRFSAKNLTFIDTVEANLSEDTWPRHIIGGQLMLHAENRFPWNMTATIYLLDEWNQILDSLHSTQPIAAAALNAQQRVEQATKSTLPYPLPDDFDVVMRKTHRFLVKAQLTSLPQGQLLSIYSDYSCKLRIVADVTVNPNP